MADDGSYVPSDGYEWLTNGTIWARSITIGTSDSTDNWHDTNELPPTPPRERTVEELSSEIDAISDELDRRIETIASGFAVSEEEYATNNHAYGECLMIDDTLYVTTHVIVRGEKIVEGVNVARTNIADEIRTAVASASK